MGNASSSDDRNDVSESLPADAADLMTREELIRLYQAERDARIAAERRLDAALRDSRDARQSSALHDYVMASAHCLLWYADIFETNARYLHWQMEFPNIEPVRHFLPIEIKPNETLSEAWYNRRHPDDRDACDTVGTAAVRRGKSYQQDFRCFCEDGSARWLHEDVHVETIVDGKHWRAVGVCTDVTAHHEFKKGIQAANKRLRRAVAETHHRVKNNLQVVAALADLYHNAEGQPVEARSAFQRMGQHIRALAAIHDLLTHEAHNGNDIENVSVRAVLERLVILVRQTLGNRQIDAHVENLRLPSHQVMALVVLVNELFSNAVKHSQNGIELIVELHSGFVHLEVCDDGPGFPPDFDPLRAAHTGLEIVQSIGHWDLQGTVSYENRPDGGARVSLEFLPAIPRPA